MTRQPAQNRRPPTLTTEACPSRGGGVWSGPSPTPLPQPPRVSPAYLGPGLASWGQVWGPRPVQDAELGTPWLCPLPDLSKPPFLATSFLASFPVALSRKRRSVPVRPAATASFESAPVFEGQPLRGFTSDVFVALPGSSGGENKRDELVSRCGPRSPLLGEQAALPGSPAAAQGSRQGRYPPLALLPSECGWGGPGAGAARAVTPGWSLSGCPCTRVPWGYRGASPLQGPARGALTSHTAQAISRKVGGLRGFLEEVLAKLSLGGGSPLAGSPPRVLYNFPKSPSQTSGV